MSEPLSRFTSAGLDEFVRWIRLGASGAIPRDLITDRAYSEPLPGNVIVPLQIFRDRFDFGQFLVELLRPFERQSISFDRGLWSWLAAYYFEQLSPRDQNGHRALRKDYVYALSESRIYYRHLVRAPWFLVSSHGDACRFLLVARQDDPAPLSRQSYLLDQLAARQFVISSPTLIAAAGRLYSDPRTGLPTRGAGCAGFPLPVLHGRVLLAKM
jgi:hypothetical protein